MHLSRSLAVLWLALLLALILAPSPARTGNTSGPTRTQTYQPGEPFTGLPGGAPGRGYGSGPSGLPSVYCQNWPGHSPYPQYPGTGPNTPCGPNFQPAPPPPPPQPPPSEPMSCSIGPMGSLDVPQVEQGVIILVQYNQPVAPNNWDQWLNGLENQFWKVQNNEVAKPFYGTNKPLFPGGQPLPRGMNWKQWWSTHGVCVSVTLRCFGTKDSQSRMGLLHSGLWKSTCSVVQAPQLNRQSVDYAPNYYYWLFIKDKVLPKVLPDDNIVPPWPQDQNGQPCPGNNLQYVNGIPAYFDFQYTFTLTPQQPSRGYRGPPQVGSGPGPCR
jgi:hypothetical protein